VLQVNMLSSMSRSLKLLMFVFLGKALRKTPFAFSIDPLCHGKRGSQKKARKGKGW